MNTSKNSDQYLEACSNLELEQEVFVRLDYVEASKKELHRLLEERARINRKILEQETLFRLRLDRLAKVREILSERGFSITHTDNLITPTCSERVLSPVVFSELLANWDTAIVDLYRNGGMFVAYDVRLRNCSLHYNDACNEYYVRYRDVTFGMHDIYNRR